MSVALNLGTCLDQPLGPVLDTKQQMAGMVAQVAQESSQLLRRRQPGLKAWVLTRSTP